MTLCAGSTRGQCCNSLKRCMSFRWDKTGDEGVAGGGRGRCTSGNPTSVPVCSCYWPMASCITDVHTLFGMLKYDIQQIVPSNVGTWDCQDVTVDAPTSRFHRSQGETHRMKVVMEVDIDSCVDQLLQDACQIHEHAADKKELDITSILGSPKAGLTTDESCSRVCQAPPEKTLEVTRKNTLHDASEEAAAASDEAAPDEAVSHLLPPLADIEPVPECSLSPPLEATAPSTAQDNGMMLQSLASTSKELPLTAGQDGRPVSHASQAAAEVMALSLQSQGYPADGHQPDDDHGAMFTAPAGLAAAGTRQAAAWAVPQALDATALPAFASATNWRLHSQIRRLEAQLAGTHAELARNAERGDLMAAHMRALQLEIGFAEARLEGQLKELEGEQHLELLGRHELVRAKQSSRLQNQGVHAM